MKKHAITDEQVWHRIFRAARSISNEHWAVCIILKETGMHAQSLVRLERGNAQHDKLRWERPKQQAKQRWLQCPMTKELAFALEVFWRYPRRTRQGYWKMVRQVGKLAGIPDLAPMTFRHSRAVMLLRSGMPLLYVEAAMGASAQVIKLAYGELTPEQLLEAQRKVLR